MPNKLILEGDLDYKRKRKSQEKEGRKICGIQIIGLRQPLAGRENLRADEAAAGSFNKCT